MVKVPALTVPPTRKYVPYAPRFRVRLVPILKLSVSSAVQPVRSSVPLLSTPPMVRVVASVLDMLSLAPDAISTVPERSETPVNVTVPEAR